MTQSDKNIVMLLLTIFLGLLGIHRFVDGKIWTGLLYLFTGGFFLIGWIFDIYCLITKGKLEFEY